MRITVSALCVSFKMRILWGDVKMGFKVTNALQLRWVAYPILAWALRKPFQVFKDASAERGDVSAAGCQDDAIENSY